MIWGRRQLAKADLARYHARIIKLLYANPAQYREFMMVGTKTEAPTVGIYYVGVPIEAFMEAFDGFELVKAADLPREIDTVIVADVSSEEFKSRFGFRSYPPGWGDDEVVATGPAAEVTETTLAAHRDE